MPPLEFAAPGRGPVCPALESPLLPCAKSYFNNPHFKIEEHSFEVVDSFTYLGDNTIWPVSTPILWEDSLGGGQVPPTSLPPTSRENLRLDDNLVALHFKYDQARRRFVEWAQNEIAVVPDFHKRILFSDEAHFWLNGYVNKQNCRIWSEANPQVYVETPLHPEKLTVWCALWAGGIIGPYFFKLID
ncbi:hypothetical protein TNCV_1123611 [Trichonephila clavipes]|uniref:Transposase n=1 Tax=Trichonephila clavipes TaxID=2585209 RepID=A0A8X6VKP5_TRICX|nr:hypothetical protein TNCV_1123611 [Trichonephila clavipes]